MVTAVAVAGATALELPALGEIPALVGVPTVQPQSTRAEATVAASTNPALAGVQSRVQRSALDLKGWVRQVLGTRPSSQASVTAAG
jgi:hypothetical protein